MGKHDAIQWTEPLEKAVLASIESGLSLRKAAEQNGITLSAVLRRCNASPSFASQYSKAMELRTDFDFETLAEKFDESPERNKWGVDSAWVNWKRLEISTMQWLIARRNPKKYGERVDHNVDGQIQVTFQAKSLLDAPAEPKQIEAGPKLIEGEL